MVSKTKFLLDDETIKRLFEKAEITGVTSVSPLGAGEFNAVYEVIADKAYVLKVAPKQGTRVLTYENDMLLAEKYWYNAISSDTDICVPEIYFFDLSCKIIPAGWLIMEKIEGRTIDKFEMTKSERLAANAKAAEIAAMLHKIHGSEFGYVQNGTYESWYLALRSMVQNLLFDIKAAGKKSRRGEKLLSYIDKYRDVFERTECCVVNTDINPANIICTRVDGKIKYTLIDPERSLWGDRLLDFCLLDMMIPLEKKKSLAEYNRFTDKPITATHDEKIRYAAANGYLALVMEAEKYYRYTKRSFGWWRNVFACIGLYCVSFKGLKSAKQ